jgi:hypothetical protein
LDLRSDAQFLLDASADRPDAREELVDERRDRVRFLEGELERRGEESERLHRIIAGLTQATAHLSSRVPELEARREEPSESPDSTGAMRWPYRRRRGGSGGLRASVVAVLGVSLARVGDSQNSRFYTSGGPGTVLEIHNIKD